MYELPSITDTIAVALAEDLGVEASRFLAGAVPSPDVLTHDVTSSSVVGLDAQFSGVVVAREACTVCGLSVAAEVFEALSRAAGIFEPVEFFPLVPEGARVEPGCAVAEVDGLAAAVLCAERTALDFMMVLSGIATQTARWVAAAGPALAVCDTRKTLPGLRALSKYAVRVGGGTNHRDGLHDMVLVKDNHLARAGGVAQAVAQARAAHPDLVLEVEADSLEQAREAVRAGADIVLLDNMDDEQLTRAVGVCREEASTHGRTVLTEASGTITLARLATLRHTGVDRVSASALTLTGVIDFGLDER
jgi:nicotinate-nucleotide pyrophosphorylase (carboxylating)